jgi:hypothetical protein
VNLVILQKIEPSILDGLGYIGRLEKKSGSKFLVKMDKELKKE